MQLGSQAAEGPYRPEVYAAARLRSSSAAAKAMSTGQPSRRVTKPVIRRFPASDRPCFWRAIRAERADAGPINIGAATMKLTARVPPIGANVRENAIRELARTRGSMSCLERPMSFLVCRLFDQTRVRNTKSIGARHARTLQLPKLRVLEKADMRVSFGDPKRTSCSSALHRRTKPLSR